jgi:hypothetical protein
MFKKCAEGLPRAVQSRFHCSCRDAQESRNIAGVKLFNVAQEKDCAIVVRKLLKTSPEKRPSFMLFESSLAIGRPGLSRIDAVAISVIARQQIFDRSKGMPSPRA